MHTSTQPQQKACCLHTTQLIYSPLPHSLFENTSSIELFSISRCCCCFFCSHKRRKFFVYSSKTEMKCNTRPITSAPRIKVYNKIYNHTNKCRIIQPFAQKNKYFSLVLDQRHWHITIKVKQFHFFHWTDVL